MEALSVALFLSVANKAFVDLLVAPIQKKFPQVEYWFLVYVALLTGGVIGWVSQANVFGSYIPDVLTGRILTSIMVGGGSSLIHDIFDKE